MPNVVAMLSIVMLSYVMLSVIMLSVVMLSAVMLNVVAPLPILMQKMTFLFPVKKFINILEVVINNAGV